MHDASLASFLSPESLLQSSGVLVLSIIIFAECGLLLGFFLPGDTLLVSAGILIAIGKLEQPLWQFLVVAPIAAILGNIVGYWIGYRAGPHIFHRPDSSVFRPEYVERTHAFFERFGMLAVLFARFVPILRTVTTVMAGVGKMRFSLYVLYSTIGGILWTDGMLLLGRLLGRFKFVQDNKQYLDYLIVAVVVLALVPTALHYLRGRRQRSRV